jgi:hypothetical protein
MESRRAHQFACIEAARPRLLAFAQAAAIPLARWEVVVPFVGGDYSLSAWLFFERDADLASSEDRGWKPRLEDALRDALREVGYDVAWLPQVEFYYDSHENVVNNWGGSYFGRLR